MRLIAQIAKTVPIHDHDGEGTFLKAISEGLMPDPSLPLDEWAESYMIIPRSTGAAEYGKYRVERTPHARLIMQALSNRHPSRRVVLMAASQMLKTQVALNWLCYVIHQHPSNFLMLMPTGKLHKRIAQRVDRVFEAVNVVKERVSPPGSRLATNSQDIKVFQGGTLYIATAGSAANLSEVPAKYVSFDEIDRAELSVDGEGDPVKLAESRQTTFSESAKSYYYSSPTIKGESRIELLYESGTQREALAECIHCGHAQPLKFEYLTDKAEYPCIECGGLHVESDKARMFKNGLWSEPKQESKTESFHISALYQPYGWLSWAELVTEYYQAKDVLDSGSDEQMTVFYNTRLGLSWERQKEQTKAAELINRAEGYKLGIVPDGALILTASVDTQDDRFEFCCIAWGEGMECWIIDYKIIHGDPSLDETKADLLNTLRQKYPHASGEYVLPINTKFIDSGGHHTQEIYDFTMRLSNERVYAIKGHSRRYASIIPAKPSPVHYTNKGTNVRTTAKVWSLGTDTAKDLIFNRLKKSRGPGTIHFSKYLPESFFKGVAESEHRITKIEKGRKVSAWQPNRKVANEPLDLLVYNVAAAYKIGLHRFSTAHWLSLKGQKKETVKPETKQETQVNKRESRGKSLMRNMRGRLNGRNR